MKTKLILWKRCFFFSYVKILFLFYYILSATQISEMLINNMKCEWTTDSYSTIRHDTYEESQASVSDSWMNKCTVPSTPRTRSWCWGHTWWRQPPRVDLKTMAKAFLLDRFRLLSLLLVNRVFFCLYKRDVCFMAISVMDNQI